jgi:hypothetical protein
MRLVGGVSLATEVFLVNRFVRKIRLKIRFVEKINLMVAYRQVISLDI